VKKLTLIVGTHNHLALGQPGFQTENHYQKSLKPFLSALYAFPDVPVVLHYSGLLMEWLEENHPEFMMLLSEMVKRKQVEVLGGGYYDPVLTMIPNNDKLGQLEKMTTSLRVRFETRPRGCWLSENVWEPSLASVLRTSGMDYTFLEDRQFRIAGVEETEGLFQPYIAEDQGKIIILLPLSTPLAALVPKGDPAAAMAFLKETASTDGARVACLMEDGTSFGEVPGEAGGSFAGGWLDGFLRLVTENAEWLSPTTPTRYLREHPPVGKLYVPCSSSADMTCWALSPRRRRMFMEAQKRAAADAELTPLLAGGYFRRFLARYPEGELMYAKMIYTHVLVNQVRGDKYKKKAAQNELWKGQCHFAYWYGAGGGIYSNVLRKAVYQSLIEAEKITRATEIFAPSIIGVDFDMDTNEEYLYQGSELNGYLHLRGGVLFELDFLPAAWNYLDTMSRRDESPISKRREGYVTDRHPRRAFLDHFFGAGSGIESFDAMVFEEAGDFMEGLYAVVDLNRSLPEVLLKRSGTVAGEGGRFPVDIEKRFIFRPRSIDVYYKVTNKGASALAARFGIEINLSLASHSPESGRLFLLDEDRKSDIGSEPCKLEGMKGLLVRDVLNEVSITLSSARESLCWSLPVETLTPHAEDGQEKIFQSYCFVPQWTLSLAPEESWENHLCVGFEKTQGS
jgi:alpha-amylase